MMSRFTLFYFLFTLVLLELTAARPYTQRTDVLSNPYARNDDLLEILDEYDYDADSKSNDILKPVEKSIDATDERVTKIQDAADLKLAQKKFSNNKMQHHKDNEAGNAGKELDTMDDDDNADVVVGDDDASSQIVNDVETDDAESTNENKAILTKTQKRAKAQLKRKLEQQNEQPSHGATQIKYYDKTDHLSDADLDFVLRELSLRDLRALSDFIDTNVIAEHTETFLESNLRAPQHYIIRLNEQPSQLQSDFKHGFIINMNLQQPNLKQHAQLALKAKRAPTTIAYYNSKYRPKRQRKYVTPSYIVDNEYLKLLAYSFPQDARQKASTDHEFGTTHVRVKRY